MDNHLPYLCDSPLQRVGGRWLLAALLIGVAALAVPTWIGWLTPMKSGLVLAFAFLMALLGSVLTILVMRFMDRRDPTLLRIQLAVFALALLVAPAAAARLNDLSPVSTLTVGFNEEFWKVFPLLMAVLFLPRWVLTIRDGILFGAAGGLGFNLMETAVYVLRMSYPELGLLKGTTYQLSRLGFWGIGNHIIWAALVGAGIGFAVQAPRSRWRYVIPLLTYLMAAVTHTAQDNGLSIVLMLVAAQIILPLFGQDPHATGPEAMEMFRRFTPQIMAAEELMINIFNLPVLLWGLLRSGRWERDAIRTQLSDEAPDIVFPAERATLLTEGRFRQRQRPEGPRQAARRLRAAQNAIAFQKQHLLDRGRTLEGDPLLAYFRDEVRRLRA